MAVPISDNTRDKVIALESDVRHIAETLDKNGKKLDIFIDLVERKFKEADQKDERILAILERAKGWWQIIAVLGVILATISGLAVNFLGLLHK